MSGSTPVHHDRHFARGNEAYAGMLGELEPDECGLCTLRVHPKPVLQHVGEGTAYHWLITERYEVPEGVEAYLLIIPKRHLTDYSEMTNNDDLAVRRLVEWAKQEYSLVGFGLTIRSGESIRTGATARHLHYHLIMPEIDPETGRAKPYHFPIG